MIQQAEFGHRQWSAVAKTGRSMAVAVAIQVASSLSNFLLTFSVGRLSRPEDFGRFAVLYAGLAVILGLVRNSLLETVLMGRTDTGWGSARRNRPDALLSSALTISGVGVLIVVGAGLGLTTGRVDLVLAVALAIPVVVANDVARYLSMARGRYQRALGSDLIWLAVMMATGLAVLVGPPDPGLINGAVSWTAGVVIIWTAGAGLGLWFNRRIFPTGTIRRLWGRSDDRSRVVGSAAPAWPLALDHLMMTGRGLLFLLTLVAIHGPGAAAAVALSQLVFQPPIIAIHGARYRYLRLITAGPDRPGTSSTVFAALPVVVGVVGLIWAAGLAATPDDLGQRILGPSYPGLIAALWPLAGFEVLRLIELPLLDRFRSTGRRRQLPRLRAVSLVAMAVVTGAMAAGAIDSAAAAYWWRFAAGAVGVVVTAWWMIIDRRRPARLALFAR